MPPHISERYIKSVKSMPMKDMPRPPFIHSFIIGDTSNITYPSQVMIESTLSTDHEMMDTTQMEQ